MSPDSLVTDAASMEWETKTMLETMDRLPVFDSSSSSGSDSDSTDAGAQHQQRPYVYQDIGFYTPEIHDRMMHLRSRLNARIDQQISAIDTYERNLDHMHQCQSKMTASINVLTTKVGVMNKTITEMNSKLNAAPSLSMVTDDSDDSDSDDDTDSSESYALVSHPGASQKPGTRHNERRNLCAHQSASSRFATSLINGISAPSSVHAADDVQNYLTAILRAIADRNCHNSHGAPLLNLIKPYPTSPQVIQSWYSEHCTTVAIGNNNHFFDEELFQMMWSQLMKTTMCRPLTITSSWRKRLDDGCIKLHASIQNTYVGGMVLQVPIIKLVYDETKPSRWERIVKYFTSGFSTKKIRAHLNTMAADDYQTDLLLL